MPETVNSLLVRKGPYFADEGDFGSAANLHIGLVDSVPKAIAQVTAGSFGYRRLFGMDSAKAGEGSVLVAGEIGRYNGPWDSPDEMHKYNGLVRYSQAPRRRFSPSPAWRIRTYGISTGQSGPARDHAGQNRLLRCRGTKLHVVALAFALSGRDAGTDDAGSWKANAYVVKSQLDLFNNFTYFLSDPVLGDQFHQHDDRVMAGGNASRTLNGSFAGLAMQTTFGVQTRYDAIDLALTDTFQRSFLSNVRSDRVGEGSVTARRSAKAARSTPGWAYARSDGAAIIITGAPVDLDTGQLWHGLGRHRQSEIPDDARPLQQDGIFRRRRRRHAQQRRPWRHHHRRPRSIPPPSCPPPLLVRTQGRGSWRTQQATSLPLWIQR